MEISRTVRETQHIQLTHKQAGCRALHTFSLYCCKAQPDLPLWFRSSRLGKASGVKQDPRPVGDKTFQANCIRRLIGYLSTHGYDQPLTPKMLASPIKQDITNVYHFLMRQVLSVAAPNYLTSNTVPSCAGSHSCTRLSTDMLLSLSC